MSHYHKIYNCHKTMKLILIFFKIAILTTLFLVESESYEKKLYERTYVDYPFCPDYYKYCTIIKMNIFNLQHYDVLDIDLGITTIRIKKTKTYGFNGTYLTEFKVLLRWFHEFPNLEFSDCLAKGQLIPTQDTKPSLGWWAIRIWVFCIQTSQCALKVRSYYCMWGWFEMSA